MDLSSVEQFTHILLLDPETLAPIDQRVVSCTKNSTQKSLALDTGDRSVADQASLLECDYGERIILKFMRHNLGNFFLDLQYLNWSYFGLSFMMSKRHYPTIFQDAEPPVYIQ